MNRMSAILAFAAFACSATAPAANEVVLGLGRSDYSENEAGNRAFGALEYHASPFGSYAGFDFGLGAAALWGAGDNYFLGAGLVVTRDFGRDDRWFVEFSEMPGYYHAGDEHHDLGKDLEFRSQLALGYRLDKDWGVSVSASHISNADLADYNPGVNFGMLRLHRSLGGS